MSILIYRKKRRGTPAAQVATHLGFTTQPGLSGASPYTLSPQPVVAAQKNDNSTDTTKTGTVTIALVALTGTPSLGGTTTKALSSGVADFSANALTVTGAGTWYLTASIAGLADGTSSTGTTTAGASNQFSDDFSGTLSQWTTSLSGTGAVADIVSGALRVGTTTGSSGTVNAQAKTTSAYILGAVGVHDLIIEWTAATNATSNAADVWVVDSSGNGFGFQTLNGASFAMQSVTVAANVASSGVSFFPVATAASPVSGSPAPIYLRFSQNGTNYTIEYSTNGTTGWTSWASGTLASANSPTTTAMNLVVIGHANGGNGLATETRWDNITWT